MAHAINLTEYAGQPGLFARLRQSFTDYRRYIATFEELDALSEHGLADLGLSRLNVRDVAWDAVYRR